MPIVFLVMSNPGVVLFATFVVIAVLTVIHAVKQKRAERQRFLGILLHLICEDMDRLQKTIEASLVFEAQIACMWKVYRLYETYHVAGRLRETEVNWLRQWEREMWETWRHKCVVVD